MIVAQYSDGQGPLSSPVEVSESVQEEAKPPPPYPAASVTIQEQNTSLNQDLNGSYESFYIPPGEEQEQSSNQVENFIYQQVNDTPLSFDEQPPQYISPTEEDDITNQHVMNPNEAQDIPPYIAIATLHDEITNPQLNNNIPLASLEPQIGRQRYVPLRANTTASVNNRDNNDAIDYNKAKFIIFSVLFFVLLTIMAFR